MNFKKKFENYLGVNLLGPGPRLMKKIYRAEVSQSLRNTAVHVSSNIVLIIRRSNCINTVSGKRSSPSDLPHAHRTVTYREYYTRCCINTTRPPDDKHNVARNM